MGFDRDARRIRVFISSTFNDMQEERESLVSKVFPLLRKLTKERQVSLTEIDLRWGITEEEAKENKVVEICINEIDKSQPFFIGILGGRYGWKPSDEKVDWQKLLPDHQAILLQNISKGMSMTELEIRHGVLENSQPEIHASFYIKKMELSEIDPQQLSLRNEIEKQNEFPVKYYKNTEELSKHVIEDFQLLLDKLYPPENINVADITSQKINSEIRQRLKNYIPREKIEREIKNLLNEKETAGICLTGEEGMGKRTLLSYIANDRLKHYPQDTIVFLSNISEEGLRFIDIVSSLCREFKRLYGFDYDENAPAFDEFKRAASILSPERKLFIFIEGIELAAKFDPENANMAWWPSWDKNIKFIFTIDEKSDILKNFIHLNFKNIPVPPLSLDERMALADNFLQREHHKKLNDSQLRKIAQKYPILDNTLIFLSFLDEIRKFGSFENLDKEIEKLLSQSNPESFLSMFIQNVRNLFKEEKERGQFDDVLSLIALSYRGITEEDLIGITNISRLNLSMILALLDLFIINVEGRLLFSNKVFINAVIDSFGLYGDNAIEIRNLLIDRAVSQINYQSELESLAESYGLDKPGKEYDYFFEFMHQIHMVEDYDELYSFLCDFETLKIYKDSGKFSEYVRYWYILQGIEPDIYDIGNLISTYEMSSPDDSFGIVNDALNLANYFIVNYLFPQPAQRLYRNLLSLLASSQDNETTDLKRKISANLALSYKMEGKHTEALQGYLSELQSVKDITDPTVANIGELLLTIYEDTEEEEILEQAIEILKDVLDARLKKYDTEIHKDIASAYANYGAAIFFIDEEKGDELGHKSLDIYTRLNGYYSIDVAIQFGNLASQAYFNNPRKAVEYGNKSLEIYMRLLNPEAEEIMIRRKELANSYIKLNEYDKAFGELKLIREYMTVQEDRLKVYINMLEMLIYSLYEKKEFEKACEVCGFLIDIPYLDILKKIDIQNTFAKILHKKGEEKKAVETYETSVDLALQIENYKLAASSLSYIAQVYFDLLENKPAKETLLRMKEVLENHNLEDSFLAAYAYFNLGLVDYNLGLDIDTVSFQIEKAISIRENLAEENDSILANYKETLESLLKAGDRPENNEETESRAVAEMKEYAQGAAVVTVEMFVKAIKAFETGHFDAASHYLSKAKGALPGRVPKSVIAQLLRYEAYTDEMLYRHSKGEKGNPQAIVNTYEEAKKLAQNDGNYYLAAKICHDMATFLILCGDNIGAEICDWQRLQFLIEDGKLFSTETAYTLFNLSKFLEKKGKGKELIKNEVEELALFIAHNLSKEERNKNSEKNDVSNLIDKLKIEGKSYESLDFDNFSLRRRWIEILIYLSEVNLFNYYRLETEVIKIALDLVTNDIDFIRLKLNYLESLRSQKRFSEAMDSLDSLLNEIASFPDYEKDYAKGTHALLLMDVYDFEKAREMIEKYDIKEERIINHYEAILPLYYNFNRGKFEEAERKYEMLSQRIADSLPENNLYDLALYCGLTGRKYEGIRYQELWWNKITGNKANNPLRYEAAKARLDSLL